MKSLLILSITLIFSHLSFAQESERARELFEEVENRRNKITYETATMTMNIIDPKGRTRERVLESYTYDAENVEKSLLIFQEPASVRGTAFLTVSEGSRDVQKLYLPALSRIQTITAAQQGDSFMGSDFTYEDLGAQDPDEYDYELISEQGNEAVIKAVKRSESQYAYIHFYIDTEKYVLSKAEYFNDKDVNIKRLEAQNYTNAYEDVWRPGKMVMYDLREDRRTELTWKDRSFNEPVPDWRFTERALRRSN
ncbi:outer membrane lipoprotein-sorting protein [Balneola sp. MJW-20]|uniref:outer membrane lipoprotein-sorting protein n=1 Tax=Gracilimonas aurantiaca TaxID=3234185 RepID=UPI0034661CCD